MNGAGATVAVWTERVSVGPGATDAVVMARRRAPGATTWSPAVALSITDVDEGVPGADPGEANGPEVAIDPAGNAVVTWWRHDGTDNVIEVSESPAGTAAWTPADEISNSDGDEAGSDLGEASSSQVAMDAAGTAYAVWLRSNGATFTVEASRLPLGGGWSNPPQVISPAGSDAATPQIAVTPAGDATAVWQLVGAPSFIQSSFLPAGGVYWSAPEA